MTDTKKRDEMAEKRARAQCSTGNKSLDVAVRAFLITGFQDGYDSRDPEVAELKADRNDQLKDVRNWIGRHRKIETERDLLLREVNALREMIECSEHVFGVGIEPTEANVLRDERLKGRK